MSHKINDIHIETIRDERDQILASYGCDESDVLSDEEGDFFYSEEDTGNPSDEGYKVYTKKIRLPGFPM